MMKKRLLAALTALCCGASLMVMPVMAEDSSTSDIPKMGAWGKGIYLVCDVPSRDADGQASWLFVKQVKGESSVEECMEYWNLTESAVVGRSSDIYDIGCGANLSEKLAGQEIIEEGDLLCIDFSGMIAEVYPACMHLEGTDTVTNLGSAEEIGERRTLTITEENGYLYTMEDTEGKVYYYYDRLNHEMFNTTTLLSGAKAGDQVEWVLYENIPALPLSVERLGDANADGNVSIVDVVMVNRHVMGADMARTTMNTDAADFDKNGEVTHEDSLSILKRLVGLV